MFPNCKRIVAGLVGCIAVIYSAAANSATTRLICDVTTSHVVGDYAPKEARLTLPIKIEESSGVLVIYSIDHRFPFKFESNAIGARAHISKDEYLIFYEENPERAGGDMAKGFVSIDRVTGHTQVVKYGKQVMSGASGVCAKERSVKGKF